MQRELTTLATDGKDFIVNQNRNFQMHIMGLVLSVGILATAGCKYNNPCANGACAPGGSNAVNSYSPPGYLGSQSRVTAPSAQRAFSTGQPIDQGQGVGAQSYAPSSSFGSGTR